MMAPAFQPIHTLAADIMARRLSPVDLVDECLSRIQRLEPKLHAFVSVNHANARLAAEAAHKAICSGHPVGPLHGIPIAVKDLVEIEGEVVTGGSAAWKDRKATRTATLMRKLLAAGTTARLDPRPLPPPVTGEIPFRRRAPRSRLPASCPNSARMGQITAPGRKSLLRSRVISIPS